MSEAVWARANKIAILNPYPFAIDGLTAREIMEVSLQVYEKSNEEALSFMENAMPAKVTKHSVMGNDSHMPVISNKDDRKNTIGMITKNPLENEIICAGRAFSVDAK